MIKIIVEDDLKKYSEIRKVQPVLNAQVAALNRKIERYEQQGKSGGEMLDSFALLKKLERTVSANQEVLEDMDGVFQFLSRREKDVIWHFYIERNSDYIDILCEKLGLERSQVYRIKDKAVRHLGMLLYGTQ